MLTTTDPALTGAPLPDNHAAQLAAILARAGNDLAGSLRDLAQAVGATLVAAYVPGERGPQSLVALEATPDGWCVLRPTSLAAARRLAIAVMLARSTQRLTTVARARLHDLAALPVVMPGGSVAGALVTGYPTGSLFEESLARLAEVMPRLAALFPAPHLRPTSAALAAFFRATDDGALVIDHGLCMRGLNPAFTAATGWGAEILGQRCTDVIRCQDEQGMALCGTAGCPLVALTPGPGTPAPRAVIRLTTPTGVAEMQVGAAALGKQHVLLARDAATLTTIVRQRDAFLSDVAHKLRNRMNSIHGFVELVASGHVGKVTPRQRQLLSYAHSSSMELMEYIENIVYLSRNDPSGLALNAEPIEPALLLEEVEQHLALEADIADVVIVRDVPPDLPEIPGDRMRIRQALLNLATNAVKFTSPGGVVRLEARREGDTLLFAVVDSGIGIAPEDQPHVFERDYQSERTARSGKSGGGLGLAAARAIVEQHEGTIWFTTAVDKGTTFFIRLPIS